MRTAIDDLALDLRGLTVLTEAATGPYVVTPLLAALAGARVIAFTKDSVHGSAEAAIAQTRHLGQCVSATPLDIDFLRELTPEVVGEADVITNSGHLRPLNEQLLRHAKSSVVVPLMYEAWEWRAEDVDLEYAKARGIRIVATNERHPQVDVFGYLGDMALRQIFDAGTCPHNNRFILLTNNDFGPHIAMVVGKVSSGLGVIAPDAERHRYRDLPGVDWIGGFPAFAVPEQYRDAEAVLVAAYPFDDVWIGRDSAVSVEALAGQLTHPLVLRFAGDIDTEALDAHGLAYHPPCVPSGHMGVLPSAIGVDAVIRLQAGGLKTAEAMITGSTRRHGVELLEPVT
jgi:hypothetical protein